MEPQNLKTFFSFNNFYRENVQKGTIFKFHHDDDDDEEEEEEDKFQTKSTIIVKTDDRSIQAPPFSSSRDSGDQMISTEGRWRRSRSDI